MLDACETLEERWSLLRDEQLQHLHQVEQDALQEYHSSHAHGERHQNDALLELLLSGDEVTCVVPMCLDQTSPLQALIKGFAGWGWGASDDRGYSLVRPRR